MLPLKPFRAGVLPPPAVVVAVVPDNAL